MTPSKPRHDLAMPLTRIFTFSPFIALSPKKEIGVRGVTVTSISLELFIGQRSLIVPFVHWDVSYRLAWLNALQDESIDKIE